MIIKRIELVNYCQHTSRVIDVSGNLIAVVGANGRGKSNLLGALQFALTGEQPGKNKADLLHWGAKEGRVILDFVQDGKPGRIERAIASNKVTLEYDGVTTSGITAVAKEMEERLHMDKDLVRQSVFVRQSEVDTIISAKTDKRDREVAFQKLIGIDAAKIHKNLTDWMYAAAKPLNYDIQITDAVKRLGELETRKEDMDKEVEKADAALSEAGSTEEATPEALAKGVAAIAGVIDARGRLSSCTFAANSMANALSLVQAQVSSAGEDPKVDVVTRLGEKAVLQDEIRKAEALRKASGEAGDAAHALKVESLSVHPEAEEIARAEARLSEMQAELQSLRAEVNTRTRALGALTGGESVCPVCGKPMDANMTEHIRAEIGDLNVKVSALTPKVLDQERAVKDMNVRKATYESRVAAARARKEAADAALAKTESPTVMRDVAEAEIARIDADVKRQQTYDQAVASHKAALKDAEIRKTVADNALADAQKRLSEAEATAVALCGPEAAVDWEQAKLTMESVIAEADKRRERVHALKVTLAQAKASRDEVAKTLTALKETVETLKEKQREQDELAKRLGVLDRVRDWFSYQKGPRVLVQQVLAALTDDVNKFLGNFTAPFVVMPDTEQLGFRVQFTDGRDRPEDPPGTDVLSGGERVQLAVAFRLAIYCMFAGKLGLLSLDEPTAYLDDGNVDRFGVLLGKVRELARNMNTQVFMATHERAVIPHMDSVIDLN